MAKFEVLSKELNDKIEAEHRSKCGLMWSVDGVDAMEYSISGSLEGNVGSKGIRPTLNSYMAANAFSIAVFAEKAGENKISQKYMKVYTIKNFCLSENEKDWIQVGWRCAWLVCLRACFPCGFSADKRIFKSCK